MTSDHNQDQEYELPQALDFVGQHIFSPWAFLVLHQVIISTMVTVLKDPAKFGLILVLAGCHTHGQSDGGVFLQVSNPRNIVFILSDKAQSPRSIREKHRS